MANEDDAEARQKRASRLRAQIAGLIGKTKGQPVEGAAGGEPPVAGRPPSPRAFIERRMRELDAGNQEETTARKNRAYRTR